MTVAVGMVLALASPALLVAAIYFALEHADRRSAHDRLCERDEHDRSVEFQGFIPFHVVTINSSEG